MFSIRVNGETVWQTTEERVKNISFLTAQGEVSKTRIEQTQDFLDLEVHFVDPRERHIDDVDAQKAMGPVAVVPNTGPMQNLELLNSEPVDESDDSGDEQKAPEGDPSSIPSFNFKPPGVS